MIVTLTQEAVQKILTDKIYRAIRELNEIHDMIIPSCMSDENHAFMKEVEMNTQNLLELIESVEN